MFYFSEEKNQWLKKNREISFEEVIFFIENGEVADIIANPNSKKYKDQLAYVIEINDYYHVVPFIEQDDGIFLKTIMKNRDVDKKYRELENGKKRKR